MFNVSDWRTSPFFSFLPYLYFYTPSALAHPLEQTYTLRRGTTSCGIHSMSFNAAATRLAVSSSNRTIHIFDISANSGTGGGERGGGRGRSRVRANTSPGQQGGVFAAGGRGARAGNVEGNREQRGANDGDSSSARQRLGTVDGSRGSNSNHETGGAAEKAGVGSGGGLAGGLRSVVGLLPNRVTMRVQDYVDSNRSFASVRLRGSAGRSICALIPASDLSGWAAGAGGRRQVRGGERRNGNEVSSDENGSGEHPDEEEQEGEILLVVTNEGILYAYAVDTVRGGECRLEQASSLLMDVSGSQEIGSELFGPARHAQPILAGQG